MDNMQLESGVFHTYKHMDVHTHTHESGKCVCVCVVVSQYRNGSISSGWDSDGREGAWC